MNDIRTLKIALVADGDPAASSTNSGVAAGLLGGLHRDPRVEVVAAIDSTAPHFLRAIGAVLAVVTSPRRWRTIYRKGNFARWAKSRQRDRLLQPHVVDVVVHVRNTYKPFSGAYVNFLDNVSSLSQKGWKPWALPEREFHDRFLAEQKQFRQSLATYTAGIRVKDEIAEQYAIPSERIVAIGGGVNPLPHSEVLRVPGRILFVGYDFERKGGDLLLEAFQQLGRDDLELVIVGPNPRAPTNEHVRWMGQVRDRQELADLYASATMFVLPAWFEPYGLVIAEAMHSGLPCLVSDSNELPRIISHERTGLVVPRGDVAALAKAIETVLDNPAESAKMGERARREVRSRGLEWDKVATRMVDDLISRPLGETLIEWSP